MTSEEVFSFFQSLVSLSSEEFISQFLSEYTLSGEKLEEYKQLFDLFKNTNGSKLKTTDKGTTLENLVVFLATNTNLFEVLPNVRTSTNEIDTLLRTKPQAKPILKSFFEIVTDILFECKNYNTNIGVTWVGKFHSLLKNQNCKFGIIFSYHGFTGTGWNDAVGLTKKVYLKDEIVILDFNFQDFEKLQSGISFLEIIRNKIDSLKNDTTDEIEKYFKPHEAEKILGAE